MLDKETAESIAEFWDIADEIESELFEQGFKPFPMPSVNAPIVTSDILTTLNDREYTANFASITQWHAYTSTQLARVKVRLYGIQNAMKHMETAIHELERAAAADLGSKKPTALELKEAVLRDPAYLKQRRKEQAALSQKEYLENYVKILEKAGGVFSRQVEIRRQEREQQRVDANMPLRGGYRR